MPTFYQKYILCIFSKAAKLVTNVKNRVVTCNQQKKNTELHIGIKGTIIGDGGIL